MLSPHDDFSSNFRLDALGKGKGVVHFMRVGAHSHEGGIELFEHGNDLIFQLFRTRGIQFQNFQILDLQIDKFDGNASFFQIGTDGHQSQGGACAVRTAGKGNQANIRVVVHKRHTKKEK